MTQSSSTSPASAPAGRPATSGQPQSSGAPAIQRQFVNFAFFKLDPAFRRLGDHEKLQARSEFLSVIPEHIAQGLICLTYSTVGLQADVRFPALADRPVARRFPGPDQRDQQDAARRLPDHAVLVRRDDQAEHVHRQARSVPHRREPHAHHPRQAQIPVRLSVREDARLVPAAAGKAAGDHGRAHPASATNIPA